MKKALLSLVAVILSVSLIARADSIEDLPDLDPGSESGSAENQNPTPLPPPPPPPSEPSTPASEAGTLRISNVSRASGGTVYRISVRPGVVVQRVSIRVNAGKVLISGARVNTTPVRNLVSPDLLTAGAAMSSEYLNERVFTIDLRMEAYGGEADVTVLVSSDERWPELSLSDVFPPQPAPPGPGNPPPPSSAGRLRTGDAVVSIAGSKYYFGVVVGVYDNGQVQVRDNDDGKTYVRSSAVVFKKIECVTSKPMCSGDRVLSILSDSKGYTGTVIGAYTNGTVLVRDHDDGKSYLRNPQSVFKAIQCFDGKCTGDRVLSGPMTSDKFYFGSIIAVYDNGIFQVRDNDDGKSYFRNSKTVKKSIRCEKSKGICEGDRVMSGPMTNGAYYMGQVVGVYQGGIVAVRDNDDGKVYFRAPQYISKRVN
ncbi:beta-sandwich domain-containing protein [Bdellovibrio sp. KM01]|uniref:beta-sandwich domain-containing protein n=1 Tax=Bdellovibrio sp. KM01 TaxID=2748865 RepID=UPI0015EADDE2|nr:beta-sandwich domain-containing protein [Bdellovibrio sp. KM01]QLY25136.1 beta-sandwich domain-containing protein [Bdellovibrio sp. KM01]